MSISQRVVRANLLAARLADLAAADKRLLVIWPQCCETRELRR